MAKNVGVKVARGLLYVIACVMAVIVVITLVISAYFTAMNTTNVNMMVKDAFAKRAQAVLIPAADGSDRIMLEKLFAPRVLSMDPMLNSGYYDGFEIKNYYEDAQVDFHIVWPWDEETTVLVTERVRDIVGKKISDVDMTTETEAELPVFEEKPPTWQNGIYEVKLKKDKVDESWRIQELELIEPIIVEELDLEEETANTDVSGAEQQ